MEETPQTLQIILLWTFLWSFWQTCQIWNLGSFVFVYFVHLCHKLALCVHFCLTSSTFVQYCPFLSTNVHYVFASDCSLWAMVHPISFFGMIYSVRRSAETWTPLQSIIWRLASPQAFTVPLSVRMGSCLTIPTYFAVEGMKVFKPETPKSLACSNKDLQPSPASIKSH